MKQYPSILLCIFCLCGCGLENDPISSANTYERASNAKSIINDDEAASGDRTSWQKPEIIVSQLGNLNGKTVADIGAGTGYFSFRLVQQAEKVIAIDIDTSMLDLIEAFKSTMAESLQEKLETRLALPDDPMLEKGEADIFLIVNTVAYLDRPQYFAKLRSLMKQGDQLMIVDYKVRKLPIDAPPYSERALVHLVEEDLLAAGFQQVMVNDTSLDYQYIIIAK